VTQEFHISVTPLRGDEYLVRVEDVEPGVPLAEEQVVWSVQDWLYQAKQLMNDPLLGVLQGDRVDRVSRYPGSERGGVGSQARQPSLVELGRELYAAIFQGTLRDSWMTAQGIAQHRGEVLRLRLGVKGSQLPKLPWEVMQGDGRWNEHNPLSRPIATGTDIVFSRYQPHTRSIRTGLLKALEPNETVRVLMVIAAPTDQQQLALKREAHYLQQELQYQSKSPTRGMIGILPDIELTILEQPGREELAHALEQGKYHVLHYAGHSNLSDGGGILHLVDQKTGLTEALNGVDLAGLLVNNGIRMAIFNSCRGSYTATHAAEVNGDGQSLTEALVSRGIPAVLAMAEQIPDAVALTLTRLFYRNLKQGYPVDLSLSRARQGLLSAYGSNQLYWALPVLYLHPKFDGYLTGGDRILDNPADSLVRIPQLYSAPLPLVPYETESTETSEAAIPQARYLEPSDYAMADDVLPVEDADEIEALDDVASQGQQLDQAADEWPNQPHSQLQSSADRPVSTEVELTLDRDSDWLDDEFDLDQPIDDISDIPSDEQPIVTALDDDRSTYGDLAADVPNLVRELSDSSSESLSSRNGNRLSVDDDLFLDLSLTTDEDDQNDWPKESATQSSALPVTSRRSAQDAEMTLPMPSEIVELEDAEAEEFDVDFLPPYQRDPSLQDEFDQERSRHSDSGADSDLYAITRQPKQNWGIWLPLLGLGTAALFAAGYWAISNRALFLQPVSSPDQSSAEDSAPQQDVNQLTRQAITHFNQGELNAGGQAVVALLDQGALIQARAALNAVPLDDIDDPWMSFLRGRMTWQLIQRGDLDFSVEDARRYWQVASRGSPDSIVYATALGFAFYSEENFTEAIASFERALAAVEAKDPSAPSLQQVEQVLDSPDAPETIQLPTDVDALMAYTGMALTWAKSVNDPDAGQRDNDALRRAIRLHQAIVATNSEVFEAEALAQNWLWTPAALEAWQGLSSRNVSP
jgi:tetratricopeptide (TPR) repeat protein